MSNKTEKPTNIHLRRLRARGIVPHSAALTSAVGFLVTVAVTPFWLGFALTRQRDYLVSLLKNPSVAKAAILQHFTISELAPQLLATIVAFVVIASTLILVGLVQVGGLAPSPTGTQGAYRNLVGSPPLPWRTRTSLVALTGNITLMIAAWFVTVSILLRYADTLVAAQGSAERLTDCLILLSQRILWAFAFCLFGVAFVDLLLKWVSFRKRSKMTLQQLKHDKKEQLGTPEILTNRRRLRTELANAEPERLLPYASLLIDDGTTLSALLTYDPMVDTAPRLLKAVLGPDRVRVLFAANQLLIPVVINDWLAHRLAVIPPQTTLPTDLEPPLAEAYATAHSQLSRMTTN